MTIRDMPFAQWSDENVADFMGEPPPTNLKMRFAYFQVLNSRIDPEMAKDWWLLAGCAPPCFQWYIKECRRRTQAELLRRGRRQQGKKPKAPPQ